MCRTHEIIDLTWTHESIYNLIIKLRDYEWNIPELPLTPKTPHNPGGLRTVAKQMSNTNSPQDIVRNFQQIS